MRVQLFLTLLLFILTISDTDAQPLNYNSGHAHSHNDYQNPEPFRAAYAAMFGSMEADIFLSHDSLIVGHVLSDLKSGRTLEQLYLLPLRQEIIAHQGHPYQDSARQLQLLIDIKSSAVPTLQRLVEVLEQYPDLTGCPGLSFVITGNRPDPGTFSAYPPFIRFDGELTRKYQRVELAKIGLMSADFKDYTSWNGKGNLSEESRQRIDSIIKTVHRLGKKIRFWDAPDFINAWYQFMDLKVDYINTDHIPELGSLLNGFQKTSFTLPKAYPVYQPDYKSDATNKKIKNIILLIGDGTALPQLYTGYTANHADLNIFKMRSIGISKTSSYDSYITDSAPGATAISSGVKTKNHYVGVDHTGAPLQLIPSYLAKRKIRTGLITCGDITDATPADFYAHQKDRGNSRAIIADLQNSAVSLLMGSGNESLENVKLFADDTRKPFTDSILNELEPEYSVVDRVDKIPSGDLGKWIVVDKTAGLSMIDGRGDWLATAFRKCMTVLSKNPAGFFLMVEGAQIDYGGHENNISYVATEVADFDKIVGEALAFADKNGETLVIVTADHETGGLTLLAGDYNTGFVSGKFSTEDHTALPVMVFAYGPHSDNFRGVYENTSLFEKILGAYEISALR